MLFMHSTQEVSANDRNSSPTACRFRIIGTTALGLQSGHPTGQNTDIRYRQEWPESDATIIGNEPSFVS
jgi:hypothetical protein